MTCAVRPPPRDSPRRVRKSSNCRRGKSSGPNIFGREWLAFFMVAKDRRVDEHSLIKPKERSVRMSEGCQTTERYDVLIVGAGISGIGGAYHLTKQCPGTRFVVLETQS